jgi:hypothetical protein
MEGFTKFPQDIQSLILDTIVRDKPYNVVMLRMVCKNWNQKFKGKTLQTYYKTSDDMLTDMLQKCEKHVDRTLLMFLYMKLILAPSVIKFTRHIIFNIQNIETLSYLRDVYDIKYNLTTILEQATMPVLEHFKYAIQCDGEHAKMILLQSHVPGYLVWIKKNRIVPLQTQEAFDFLRVLHQRHLPKSVHNILCNFDLPFSHLEHIALILIRRKVPIILFLAFQRNTSIRSETICETAKNQEGFSHEDMKHVCCCNKQISWKKQKIWVLKK